MKKIVSVIKPFILKQTSIVYEDGNKLEITKNSMKELPNTIINLAKKYELTDIELAGPKSYLNNIKQKIEELEMTTYNTNNLQIKIL